MTAFPFDTNPNEPTKLGLIVLSSDETIEDEFRAMLPKSCSLFQTRIHSAPEVTPDTLMEMKAGLAASAAMIPPSFNVDVIGYACTSGATMIGPNNVAAEVQKVHPGPRMFTRGFAPSSRFFTGGIRPLVKPNSVKIHVIARSADCH